MTSKWRCMVFAPLVAVLAVAPAQAISRLNDGRVTVAMVNGTPCFAVDRYLGPISLIHTRKIRPDAGSFAVVRLTVRSARAPFDVMWRIQAPRDAGGWRLDPGQCMAMGSLPPSADAVVVAGKWPLPAGLYEVTLSANDLKRDAAPRLSATFCVSEGRLQEAERQAGREVCSREIVDDGRHAVAPAILMAKP